MDSYDIIVIGGGSAGLTVTSGAAKFGLKVAFIEKEKLGGDCTWSGCVPSKTLLHSAKVVSLMRRAKDFGLDETSVSFDFSNLIGHVQNVINKIYTEHDSPEKFTKMGVDVIFGEAKFLSPHEIEINGRKITSKKFVISTGSRSFAPPIEGLNETGFITHVDVFHLKTLPQSLIVIGAGPIGMEMAQAFARFGSDVTVIEMMDRILSIEDEDVSKALEEYLSAEGIKFSTGTKAKRFFTENGKKVVLVERNGEETKFIADEILISVGRAPNVERLNLEAAGVEYNRKGIVVNEKLQTTAKNIWACGDVVGPYLFTHMAEYQAGIVVRNALLRLPAKVDYSVVPWTTFTDPEVAHVGITEAEAKKKGIKYGVYKHHFNDVDRAVTEVEGRGFVKIITTGWKGKIIGAQIIGPSAGELISELVLAVKNGLTVKDISSTIHVYPTLALGTRQTTDQFFRKKFDSSPWLQKSLKLMAKAFNR
ncbi:MAG TPA: dihydrolipoyl dehydrogenase [Thermodesulfobacteriota bacterium]|nr:dihydrolipoyl dehydrogenase [Thermodesulfobacteriota bacterium]